MQVAADKFRDNKMKSNMDWCVEGEPYVFRTSDVVSCLDTLAPNIACASPKKLCTSNLASSEEVSHNNMFVFLKVN